MAFSGISISTKAKLSHRCYQNEGCGAVNSEDLQFLALLKFAVERCRDVERKLSVLYYVSTINTKNRDLNKTITVGKRNSLP